MAKVEKRIKRYPSNIDAEKSMLACLLLDRHVVQICLGRLCEADFLEQKHKSIFKAMQVLDAQGVAIDVISVSDILPTLGVSTDDVNLDYLIELTDFLLSTSGYETYVDILKKNTLLRQLLDVSNKIADDVYTSTDAEACLEKAQQYVLDVSKQNVGSTLVSVADIVPQVINDIQEEAVHGKKKGLETGFKNMDFHFNGLKRSDVILLAARPGIGKTAFAMNIVCNIANNPQYRGKNKKNILIFSLEMSDKQLVTRMLCNIGKLENDKLTKNNLEMSDYVKIRSAGRVLAESGIYIDQSTNSNPMQLFSKCKQFKIEHGSLDLLIIDYLQLMELPSDMAKESRQQEVSTMSRRIKVLAKELDVPVILLSQLSRGSEQRKEKPQLHDLRDSGSIEQDADIVLMLYKEKDQDKDNEIIELIVAKYRNGRQTSLAFKWNGPYFEFEPQDEDVLNHIVTYGANGQQMVGGKAIKAGDAVATPVTYAVNTPQEPAKTQEPVVAPNSEVIIEEQPKNDANAPVSEGSGISVEDDKPPFEVNTVEGGGLEISEDEKPVGGDE